MISTWNPNYWASYNMTLTLSGACAAECNDPVACNYVPDLSTLTTMFVNMPRISSR